jgi:hypothetical protein
MQSKCALLLLASLSGCGNPTPEQQVRFTALLTVACNVDGAIVPVAQPIVATLGSAGTSASNVDLLVHPAVVAACQALKGVPVSAMPVASATVTSGNHLPPAGHERSLAIACEPADPLLDAPLLY